MKYYRRALYDQFVHFYNTISDDGSSEAQIRGKIGGFVRRARKEISPDWPKEEQIHQYYSYFMVIGAFIVIQKSISMHAICICLMCWSIVKECQ